MGSRASSWAVLVVVAFVLIGLGMASVLIGPTNFAERVLAFVAGCGLAFGMMLASRRLAAQASASRPTSVTEIRPGETSASLGWPPPRRVLERRWINGRR
jgi:protein-S-isoprenylcysteine O-methyltransferase Ste14